MERFALLLFALNVGLYTSDMYLYLYDSGETQFKPVYWYVATLAFAAAVLLGTRLLRGRPLPTSLLFWILGYFAYVLTAYVYSSQSPAAVQMLVTWVEMGLLFLAFLLLFQINGAPRAARQVLLIVSVAAACMNFIDFASPTWTDIPGRAAGLYGNPNSSATMLTLCMVAAVGLLPARLRLAYCLFIGAAVLVTFSRGGWLQWSVALFALAVMGVVRSSVFTALSTVAGVAVLFFLLFSGAGEELFKATGADANLSRGALERLHSPLAGDSAKDRLQLFEHASEVFFENPLFGKGLGFTQEWHAPQRPHDMYLYLAAEGGIVGLALFLSLLAVMWQLTQGQDRLIVALFAILSLFSHNAFEKPELFLILALAVSSSFFSRRMVSESVAPPRRGRPVTDEQAPPWGSAIALKEPQ